MRERNGRASWNKVGLVTFSSKHYIKISCLARPLPASPFVATIYLLEQRSFSRYYLVYQSFPCRIRLLSSSPLMRLVPPSIFHILPLCEFYSLLQCHKGTSVHLLPPPLDCCLYLFLLSGREGGGGNQHTTKAPKHERRGQRSKKNPNAVRTNGCKIGRSIRRGAACWSCGRPV